jgi:hypothetical protein
MDLLPSFDEPVVMILDETKRCEDGCAFHAVDRPDLLRPVRQAKTNHHQRVLSVLDVNVRGRVLTRWPVDTDDEAGQPEDNRHVALVTQRLGY